MASQAFVQEILEQPVPNIVIIVSNARCPPYTPLMYPPVDGLMLAFFISIITHSKIYLKYIV